MSILSIKDKLGRTLRPQAISARPAVIAEDRLGFKVFHNRAGEFLMNETAVQEDISFGRWPGQVWGMVGKDISLEQMELANTCFIDLETTGLNLGAGGFAFTIGVGYLGQDRLMVRQYFLRDHRDELAALLDLTGFLEQFQGLVTFNGKSFDWPLLCDRFNFHRLSFPPLERLHLDLLHASRRIWKGVLNGFSLKEVERRILARERANDIPGYLIPAAYTEFLRTGAVHDIRRIIAHNYLDIVSLMGLAPRAGQVFLGIDHCEFRQEIVNAGRMFAWRGEWARAVAYLETVLDGEGASDYQILCLLAALHKRKGDYNRAARLWQEAVNLNRLIPEPWIELAKHFEHREKDLKAALRCAQQAMRVQDGRLEPELQKRLLRLKAKLTHSTPGQTGS